MKFNIHSTIIFENNKIEITRVFFENIYWDETDLDFAKYLIKYKRSVPKSFYIHLDDLNFAHAVDYDDTTLFHILTIYKHRGQAQNDS